MLIGKFSVKKYLSVLIFSVLFSASLTSVAPVDQVIRFSLWTPLESYPGSGEEFDPKAPFAYPIQRLKEVVPFFIEGMVCGWRFTYTPSDKMRNVEEYFEFEPLREYPNMESSIKYLEPWVEGNRLNCWIEFYCPPYLTAWREQWNRSQYKKISGRGYGSLMKGFDGIYEGASEALREAVRAYGRTVVKNKPQEISGEVLLTGLHSIGLKAGRYVVDLDFFLNVSRIKAYSAY